MKTLSLILKSPMSHLTAEEIREGVASIDQRLRDLQAKRREFSREQRSRGITPNTKGATS